MTLGFRKGHCVISLFSPCSECEHSPTEKPYFDLFPGCLEIYPQPSLPLKLVLVLKSNLFPLNGKGGKKGLEPKKVLYITLRTFSQLRKERMCLLRFLSLLQPHLLLTTPIRQQRMPFLLCLSICLLYGLVHQPITIKVTFWDITLSWAQLGDMHNYVRTDH